MLMLSNRTRPQGPSLALDLYSREALLNPHETYRRIREAGAAVWLQKHRMWAIGRFRDVREALRDDETFRSGKGVAANRLTNAFMEGLNSVFSAVKRKARGFRSSVYLITVLYLVAGKLRLPHR